MKIQLISVGAMRERPLKELSDKFCSRISRYTSFEEIIIPDTSASKNLSTEIRKIKEGEAILAKIGGGDFVVLFDERGKELTSKDLSEFINHKFINLGKNLVFVIGGPYGFSEKIYKRANEKLSLSKMTFTHEMARMLALEQIYRALTIMRGEPYHHD